MNYFGDVARASRPCIHAQDARVTFQPQGRDHIRLANEEVRLIREQKAAAMLKRGTRFRIIRKPVIQKHVEIGLIP